jgi:hypothetical protein
VIVTHLVTQRTRGWRGQSQKVALTGGRYWVRTSDLFRVSETGQPVRTAAERDWSPLGSPEIPGRARRLSSRTTSRTTVSLRPVLSQRNPCVEARHQSSGLAPDYRVSAASRDRPGTSTGATR